MWKSKDDEWLMEMVQYMYKEMRSKVKVGNEYSNWFDVRVGVHPNFVLSPLLSDIFLKPLFVVHISCPYMYVDDLMVRALSIDGFLAQLKTWGSEMEIKGLRVNLVETKLMVFCSNLDVLKESAKYLCGVCHSCE